MMQRSLILIIYILVLNSFIAEICSNSSLWSFGCHINKSDQATPMHTQLLTLYFSFRKIELLVHQMSIEFQIRKLLDEYMLAESFKPSPS